MTVFQELTKGMKFSEPTEDIKKNMVKVFEKSLKRISYVRHGMTGTMMGARSSPAAKAAGLGT